MHLARPFTVFELPVDIREWQKVSRGHVHPRGLGWKRFVPDHAGTVECVDDFRRLHLRPVEGDGHQNAVDNHHGRPAKRQVVDARESVLVVRPELAVARDVELLNVIDDAIREVHHHGVAVLRSGEGDGHEPPGVRHRTDERRDDNRPALAAVERCRDFRLIAGAWYLAN